MEHEAGRVSQKTAAVIVAAIVVLACFASLLYYEESDESYGPSSFPSAVSAESREVPLAADASDEFDEILNDLASALSNSSYSASTMADEILEAYNYALQLIEWKTWAMINYYEDPDNYSDEYESWSVLASTAINDTFAVVGEALDGDCADTVEKAAKLVGHSANYFRSFTTTSDEELTLLAEESALETAYYAVLATDYTVTYNDKEWTYDDVVADDSLTSEEYEDLIGLIYDAMMYDAAAIYIDLVGVRNDLAVIYGYENYIDYAYAEVYDRDYEASDTSGLLDVVYNLYQLYAVAEELIAEDPTLDESYADWLEDLTHDEKVSLMGDVVSGVDPDGNLYSLLEYMEENELLYIDNTGNVNSSIGFTSTLYLEDSAVIFVSGYTGWNSFSTIMHEFGHASNTCLNANRTSCMDVKEIHSQGMEALLWAGAEDYIGETGLAMAVSAISDNAQSLISITLMSQFEIQAFYLEADGTELTVSMLSELYQSITASTGLKYKTSYDPGLIWTLTRNMYTSSGYMVSYVTSGLNMLEIFAMAVDDYGEASEAYLKLLYQEDVDGYTDAVKKAGLSNMLKTSNARSAIQAAADALEKLASS